MSTPAARSPGLVELHRQRREARDREMATQIRDFVLAEGASLADVIERYPGATLNALRLAWELLTK